MNSHELRELLRKTESISESKKLKRAIFAILIYSAVLFAIFWLLGQIDTTNVLEILGAIGVSIILGGITFFFNALIWIPLCEESEKENRAIAFLKKQIEQKEREESRK